MKHLSIHILILYHFFLCNVANSSVLIGSLIKTPDGFVLVENLSLEDKLTAYANGTLVSCKVKEVVVATTDTIIELTTEAGMIKAAPDQYFYDPAINMWIAANEFTSNNYFLNAQLEHIRCINVKSACVFPTNTYRLTLNEPHTFFITEQELLTHNFFPLVLGASWLFGLGSIEFAGINIATIIAGTAIGVRLFKSKKDKNKKTKITIVPHIHGSCGGTPDPNDEEDSKNEKRKVNNTSKSEFFKKIKDQYEYWKDGTYKRKHGCKGIENAEYLKWDHLHGDVEAYSKSRMHLGSIDPETLQLYKVTKYYKI